MKTKQRKSPPWKRFGYVILIIIKFEEVLLWFSPRISNALRSYIKHRKSVSSDIRTLRSWLNNSAAPRFLNPLLSVWISDETLFLVFDIFHLNSGLWNVSFTIFVVASTFELIVLRRKVRHKNENRTFLRSLIKIIALFSYLEFWLTAFLKLLWIS